MQLEEIGEEFRLRQLNFLSVALMNYVVEYDCAN